MLLGYYILAFDPELDPFRSEGEISKKCQFPNPIDGLVLALVRSIPDMMKLPSFRIIKTEELDLALNSVRHLQPLKLLLIQSSAF